MKLALIKSNRTDGLDGLISRTEDSPRNSMGGEKITESEGGKISQSEEQKLFQL